MLFSHRFAACPLKQQVNAPKPAETDKRIYYSAYYGALPSEYPSDEVKLEQSDQTPVNGADYYQYQRKFIEHY